MSATRLLLRPNKAAIGWAVLARRNGTVPALPSCSPFPYCATLARRNGTVPALPSCSPFPYCTALARRNSTAPAIPSCSPFPYRRGNGTAPALLSVGPRHMSSDGRRAFLLDRIASRLEAEGIPYTEALDKIISEFLDSKLDKIQSREHRVSLLKRDNEKLIRKIEKMHSELRDEMDKDAARRLDLNLERGRIRDEVARQHAEMTNLITELDQENFKE